MVNKAFYKLHKICRLSLFIPAPDRRLFLPFCNEKPVRISRFVTLFLNSTHTHCHWHGTSVCEQDWVQCACVRANWYTYTSENTEFAGKVQAYIYACEFAKSGKT